MKLCKTDIKKLLQVIILLCSVSTLILNPTVIFAQSEKAKVDVESLGLDAVDEKTKEIIKNNSAIKKSDSIKVIDSKIPSKDRNSKQAKNSIPKAAKKNIIKSSQTNSKKALVKKTTKKKKKTTSQYINSKKSLKARIEKERRSVKKDFVQDEMAKKLKNLREKYLIKINKNNTDVKRLEDYYENLDEEDKKIIPIQKEVSRYKIDEMPPPPIMDKNRAIENIHIPLIMTGEEKETILFDAIYAGDIKLFNEIYRQIANPNLRNKSGDTILTYAILLQKYPIIASIISLGADVNLPNQLGYMPLSIALEIKDVKSLEMLIENNVDLNYIDAFGRTYLMHASRLGFLYAVQLLISKNVNPNIMDNDGFTALSFAYRNKQEMIVKYLIKNGAKTWIERPFNPYEQPMMKELEDRWKY